MRRNAFSAIMVALLLLGTFMSAFNVAIPDVNETTTIRPNGASSGLEFSQNPSCVNCSYPTYSASVQAEWNETYGGTDDDSAASVQQTSDGGYILAGTMCPTAGTGNWDFWLLRTDACGNMLWNRSFGGAYSDDAYSIQQTSDGGYIVAGWTKSFGAGGEDAWLVKIEADGILPVYDIAVVSVAASKTIVGQGHPLTIKVTVKNYGSFQESFNVSLSCNSTIIENQTVLSLNPCNKRNLTFIWNTTDVAPGNYTLSAYATPVPSETETDNNIYIDGTVKVRIPIHDVAITKVEPEKTVVGIGYSTAISVIVMNKGDFTDIFNLTAYANTTIIQTETITLANGTSLTITLSWNTTGVTKGNYTISATAPLPGDNNPDDNTLTNGWVIVTIPGDVDGDFDVDIYDVVLITSIYGSSQGDPSYSPNSDIDCNGEINIYDVVLCTSRYGQKDP